MCTLAIYFQTSPDYPIVVAANRDEFYERPATAPARLADGAWIVAGQDQRAGGTWLGVNAYGLLAGIVNRRASSAPDATRRSRGRLCLDVLREAAVPGAARRVEEQAGTSYNPFNLLIASPRAACVVGNVSGTMRGTKLQPGLHLLTNLELNDPECPRIAKSYGLFEAVCDTLRESTLANACAALQTILADHSTPLDPRSEAPPNNLCVHTERFGTRSSTVIVYGARTGSFRMWYADGPPCQTPFVEIQLPPPMAPKKC